MITKRIRSSVPDGGNVLTEVNKKPQVNNAPPPLYKTLVRMAQIEHFDDVRRLQFAEMSRTWTNEATGQLTSNRRGLRLKRTAPDRRPAKLAKPGYTDKKENKIFLIYKEI
jgi:hypothetical protein